MEIFVRNIGKITFHIFQIFIILLHFDIPDIYSYLIFQICIILLYSDIPDIYSYRVLQIFIILLHIYISNIPNIPSTYNTPLNDFMRPWERRVIQVNKFSLPVVSGPPSFYPKLSRPVKFYCPYFVSMLCIK